MAIIVPAILEQTKEGFLEKLSKVAKLPGLERIQVDFGDGIFIANKLLSASDMDTLNPAFHWEAHLMVDAPKDFLDYQICGFKTLIVHYEAYPSPAELKQALADIKQLGLRTSVAINPDTPVEVLRDIDADQYLIMSVVPGKQGQALIEASWQRIKQLRSLKPHAMIEIDGGVNQANIKNAKDAGADLICVGSALVKADDAQKAYDRLIDEIM